MFLDFSLHFHSLDQQWQVIPEGFATEHGAKLPKTVSLKLPNGSEWKVRVTRSCRKNISFNSGWREFVQFNSLTPGHILVFHYDSSGHFLVFIFDVTGTEIGYKTKEAINRAVKLECGVPLNDQFFPSPKTRGKPPLTSPQPHKLRRNDKGKSVMNSEAMFCVGSSSSMDKQARKRTSEKKTPSLTDVEKAKLLARASAGFKSRNPFFMLAMQPSYVGPRVKISLPLHFFKSNFKKQCGLIMLQVPDGRAWTVEYRVQEYGSRRKATFTTKSWSPFVRENSLKVGDVCAFELVIRGAPVLNVVIFRAPQDLINRCSSAHGVGNETNEMKPQKKSSSSPGKTVHGTGRRCPSSTNGNASKRRKQSNNGVQLLSVESSRALEAAKAFSSNRPFFKVAVEASHLSIGRMSIPMSFSSHVKEFCDKAELWVADKCWGVIIRKYTKNTGSQRNYLGSGWGAFAAGNSLEVGDVCIYEVMKGEADDDDDSRRNMVFSVHIFRG
ncbi:B3 domain-containing transcription factor VRN1 [Linum grandiflorum]